MPFTIKYDDVTDFHIASATQIYTWNETLADVQEKFTAFTEMESMKGISADNIKNYISETHGSIMLSLSEILVEFQSRMLLYKDGFYEEVDDDMHSLITEEPIKDWKDTVKMSYGDFLEVVSMADNAASKVNDLVSGLPSAASVESGYLTTDYHLQTIVDKAGNYDNYHFQNDFTNLKSLIDSLTAFCNEMLENKPSDIRDYQAGSIQNLASFQTLSNTVTDAFNARKEIEPEINKASENESVRQEALAAEERIEQGWVKAVTSALIVVGGAICIVATAGLATPLVVAGAIAGTATMAYGWSEMSEAENSINLGLAGDGHTAAFNPIRDTIFQGNQEAYNIFGFTAVATSTIMTLGAGAYGAVGAAANAGTSAVRAVAVYGGKVVIGAAGGMVGNYAGNQVGHAIGLSDNYSQLLGIFGGLAGAAVAGWGANAADKALNLSGTNIKPAVSNDKSSESAAEQRQRILDNIAESKKARESSNFGEYASKEKQILENIKQSQNSAGTSSRLKYNDIYFEGSTKVGGVSQNISRKVYQLENIDYNRIDDATGLTNLELMEKGRAPIWEDGSKIELHHMLQMEPGPMAELPSSLHDQYHSVLHGLVENGNSFRNDSTLAKQYNNFRSQYWKWRASQF